MGIVRHNPPQMWKPKMFQPQLLSLLKQFYLSEVPVKSRVPTSPFLDRWSKKKKKKYKLKHKAWRDDETFSSLRASTKQLYNNMSKQVSVRSFHHHLRRRCRSAGPQRRLWSSEAEKYSDFSKLQLLLLPVYTVTDNNPWWGTRGLPDTALSSSLGQVSAAAPSSRRFRPVHPVTLWTQAAGRTPPWVEREERV